MARVSPAPRCRFPMAARFSTYSDVSDCKARGARARSTETRRWRTRDRVKTAFVSHVSYELRTPLTNIIGFTELLASPATRCLWPRSSANISSDIRSSGQTLLAIIDDILDLATIDAGTFELKLSPVKVREVIDAAVHGVRERLKQNDVELDISDRAWSRRVRRRRAAGDADPV